MTRILTTIAIALVISITACVEPATAPHTDCGPLPSRGSYTATYGPGTVTLSREDFDGLVMERHALKAYVMCVAGEAE